MGGSASSRSIKPESQGSTSTSSIGTSDSAALERTAVEAFSSGESDYHVSYNDRAETPPENDIVFYNNKVEMVPVRPAGVVSGKTRWRQASTATGALSGFAAKFWRRRRESGTPTSNARSNSSNSSTVSRSSTVAVERNQPSSISVERNNGGQKGRGLPAAKVTAAVALSQGPGPRKGRLRPPGNPPPQQRNGASQSTGQGVSAMAADNYLNQQQRQRKAQPKRAW